MGQSRELVLGRLVDNFCFALTGEPPVAGDPLRVTLRPNDNLGNVKANPRLYAPEKIEWIQEQIDRLAAAGMVYCNP